MKTKEISDSAEKIVAALLRSNGYFRVVANQKQTDEVLIEADSTMRKILVEVKISTPPNILTKLSATDIKEIKILAENKGREPWGAIMQIDSDGQLIGSIKWQNFAK